MVRQQKDSKDQEYVNGDEDVKNHHQIVYYGWKEGGDVEQVEDGSVRSGAKNIY